MITEFGRLLIDTVNNHGDPSTSTAPVQTIQLNYGGLQTEVSCNGTKYNRMNWAATRYLPMMFFSMRSNLSSITLYYGDEIVIDSDAVFLGHKKQYLPYSAVCNCSYDSNAFRTVLGGAITNTSTTDKVIKYIGIQGKFGLTNTNSSSEGSVKADYVLSGVLLSYIELPEPITLKQGESYAFTITPDMMV